MSSDIVDEIAGAPPLDEPRVDVDDPVLRDSDPLEEPARAHAIEVRARWR